MEKSINPWHINFECFCLGLHELPHAGPGACIQGSTWAMVYSDTCRTVQHHYQRHNTATTGTTIPWECFCLHCHTNNNTSHLNTRSTRNHCTASTFVNQNRVTLGLHNHEAPPMEGYYCPVQSHTSGAIENGSSQCFNWCYADALHQNLHQSHR